MRRRDFRNYSHIQERAEELLADSILRYENGDEANSPSKRLYHSVLKLYAVMGDATSAEDVVARMQKLDENGYKNMKPDFTTYTELITAYAKSPSAHRADLRATELIRNMIKAGDETLMPNAYTFSNYLLVISRSKGGSVANKLKLIQWAMNEYERISNKKTNKFVLNNVIKDCSTCGIESDPALGQQAFQIASTAFTKLHKNSDGKVQS